MGGNQSISTTSAEVNSSEPAQGAEDLIVCESPCMFAGETHSCRKRVQWLVKEGGSTVAAALDIVSHECDGQCMCSPTGFPEFHCESPCTFDGETYSCRERVQWLVGEGNSTVASALDTVSYECGGQCMCRAADFGVQDDLFTTTSAEVNSS